MATDMRSVTKSTDTKTGSTPVCVACVSPVSLAEYRVELVIVGLKFSSRSGDLKSTLLVATIKHGYRPIFLICRRYWCTYSLIRIYTVSVAGVYLLSSQTEFTACSYSSMKEIVVY